MRFIYESDKKVYGDAEAIGLRVEKVARHWVEFFNLLLS